MIKSAVGRQSVSCVFICDENLHYGLHRLNAKLMMLLLMMMIVYFLLLVTTTTTFTTTTTIHIINNTIPVSIHEDVINRILPFVG